MPEHHELPPPSVLPGVPSDSRVANVRIFCSFMIAIPTIAVICRFWSRWVASKKKFWWDDWMLLFAIITSNACNGAMIYWTHHGLGKHLYTIPYETFSEGMLSYIVAAVFHQWSAGTFRTAAILLYYRVFVKDSATKHKKFQTGLWICQGFTTFFCLFTTFYLWFQCDPPRKIWDPRTPGSCHKLRGNLVGSSGCAAALDLAICTLPIPVIWKLQMSRKKKLMLCGVIVLSYNVFVVALFRVIYFALKPQQLVSVFQEDFPYTFVPSAYIMTLESGIACFTLSLPPMYQLYQRARTQGFRALTTSRDSYSGSVTKTATSGFDPHSSRMRAEMANVRMRDDLEYQSASSRGGHEKLVGESSEYLEQVHSSHSNITPLGDEEKQIAVAY